MTRPRGVAMLQPPPYCSFEAFSAQQQNPGHRLDANHCGHGAGSTESISAMLDRVEADERALMSDITPPTVPFEFGTPVRLEGQAGESPLGNTPEGGSSTLPLSPTAQRAHLLQLDPLADAAAPSAHQV